MKLFSTISSFAPRREGENHHEGEIPGPASGNLFTSSEASQQSGSRKEGQGQQETVGVQRYGTQFQDFGVQEAPLRPPGSVLGTQSSSLFASEMIFSTR